MDHSWKRINELEAAEDYPAAIELLEARLKLHPEEREIVLRLGFDLWLAIAEVDRLFSHVPVKQFAARFLDLLQTYEPSLGGDADFCWAYGLPLSLGYCNFARDGQDVTELDALRLRGQTMCQRASKLDPFYGKLLRGDVAQQELADRFLERGCFAKYYNVI